MFTFSSSENENLVIPEIFKDDRTKQTPISYDTAAAATQAYRDRNGIQNIGPVFCRNAPGYIDGVEIAGYCYYDAILGSTPGMVSIPRKSDGTEIRIGINFKPCPPCERLNSLTSNREFERSFLES